MEKIEKTVSIPMSVDTMKDYLEKKNMNLVFLYDTNNITELNELFKNKSYVVLFVATKSRYNGHYVGMIKDDESKIIYFFDSYGMTLNFLLISFPNGDGYVQSKNILHLIAKSGYKLICNKTDYQKRDPTVATCGRFVLMFFILYRIITKHYKLNFSFKTMENAMNQIKKKLKMNYDEIVSYFINKLN